MPNRDAWRASLNHMLGPSRCVRGGTVFSTQEVDVLRRGIWPRDMDDRWAIWLDGNVLRCWRSWSGVCVYEADVQFADDGSAEVVMIHVVDDPSSYHPARNDREELERFEGTIRAEWQTEWPAVRAT